jgi:hypothetical protein
VLTVAAGSLIGARGPGGRPDMRMAFTNVRLLPCIARAGVERQIEMLTLAIARGGGTPAPAVATTSIGGADGGSGTRASSGHGHARAATAAGAVDTIAKLFEPVRDGFEQVVRDAADEAADGLSDSRLMTQIGMLLGFVYLGFLTVWFWATRIRRGDLGVTK